jgi:ABC-type uncharacterized transport system substrate-binding protein
MTPKSQSFVAENKKSPVVYGAATHIPGEAEAPENVTGCRYTLENGRTFTLTSAECRTVKPKWKLP